MSYFKLIDYIIDQFEILHINELKESNPKKKKRSVYTNDTQNLIRTKSYGAFEAFFHHLDFSLLPQALPVLEICGDF